MQNISIVMPAFNSEKYISESIDSVIVQSYPNWELIIVNDGSEDKTKQIIETYRKKYPNQISLIDKEKNEGITSGLNAAISKAKGPFICWLSSDDVYDPDMLMTEYMYLNDHAEYDIVFSNYQYIDQASNLLPDPYNYHFFRELREGVKTQPYKSLLEKYCLNGCSVLWKKEHSVKVGEFDHRYRYAHDYDMWIRLAAEYNIGYIDRVNVRYRIHPEQGTNLGMNDVDSIQALFSFMRREEFNKMLRKAEYPEAIAGVLKVIENILIQFKSRKKEFDVLLGETKRLFSELSKANANDKNIYECLVYKKMLYLRNNYQIKNKEFFNGSGNNWIKFLCEYKNLDGFFINSEGARFECFEGNDIKRLSLGIKYSNQIVICHMNKKDIDLLMKEQSNNIKYQFNPNSEKEKYIIGISYYMLNDDSFSSYFTNCNYSTTDEDIWNTIMNALIMNNLIE